MFKIHNHVLFHRVLESFRAQDDGYLANHTAIQYLFLSLLFRDSIASLLHTIKLPQPVGQRVPVAGGINAGCCSILHQHFYFGRV